LVSSDVAARDRAAPSGINGVENVQRALIRQCDTDGTRPRSTFPNPKNDRRTPAKKRMKKR
jgi:hypothetical protein